MSNETGNTLLLTCGDKRLGAKFLGAMQQEIGRTPYILMIPGPDACVMGDPEHLTATVFFVQRFYNLTQFDELVHVVHEDCAGCQCDIDIHEKNVVLLAQQIANRIGFKGVSKTYIARRPASDDFADWKIELIDGSNLESIAA